MCLIILERWQTWCSRKFWCWCSSLLCAWYELDLKLEKAPDSFHYFCELVSLSGMTDNAVYKVRYCLGKNKSTVHVLYRCMQLFIFLLNKSGSPLYKYKCTSGSLAFLYIWYSDLHFLLSNKWKYPYEFYMLLHIVNIMIKPPKMWFHLH